MLIFLCSETRSQNTFDSSYANAISVYKKTIGTNTHLYRGKEYTDYDHRITGTPFFNDSYFAKGSIVYDEIFYNNVQLFYDILHDDVVIRNYNDTPLVLVKEKISAFNYGAHRFINLSTDSSLANSKISGFYEVLYNGNTKFFAKHKKEIAEKITTTYSESHFAEKKGYYILKDNIMYAADDKNSVLAIMKDHKNDMNKFLHQYKIKFKNNFENAVTGLLQHYDELISAK